jgi:hypothetical protein
MEQKTATEVVEKAALFVQAVERAFGLNEHSLGTNYDNDNPKSGDKVSESNASLQAFSLEEERRQARENWVRLRQQKITGDSEIGHERDAASATNDRGHSLDTDLNE